MTFAKRTNWDLRPNELAEALAKHRASGKPLIDLTISNPTECGFEYDTEAILGALRNAEALRYEPDPKGMRSAREAVAGYYADRGDRVSPEDIFLTTSTSEAYSWVFRLLCDPGDEVLIPSPGYPLFYDHGWHYDMHALAQAISPRTRAVMVVHPNNPTGNYCKPEEMRRLNEICLAHGLAIVADEVFLDYAIDGQRRASFATNGTSGGIGSSGSSPDGSGTERGGPARREPEEAAAERKEAEPKAPERSGPLTFTLSGLSKICGLPQMKVAWLVVSGPEQEKAMARLEMISDTYLSLNAPVQLAVPALLATRHGFQKQVLERVRANVAEIDRWLGGATAGFRPGNDLAELGDDPSAEPVSGREDWPHWERLAVEGGWCAVLRRPVALRRGGCIAEASLNQGVCVHPGVFYGLRAGDLAVTAIDSENDIRNALEHLKGL